MKLYPLKFTTIYKDKIWGGQKINDILGKNFDPLPNCGETWEISGVEENISEVSTGPLKNRDLKSLIQEFKGDLVGTRVYEKYEDDFPLLIKFIDANDDLSIQVHPDDELAKLRHNSFGKTEMWYVMQADEGSSLISGFNKNLTKEEYLETFNSGRLTDILNREEVSTDDVFYLPAGRVHTIGKGLMIAEIQQTSDITYRIYDFDRKDAEGNTRELHVNEALDAIDYNWYPEYKTKYSDQSNTAVKLVKSDYFETNKIVLDAELERDFSDLDSFVIYICLEGNGELIFDGETTEISMGDSILVPANIKKYKLSASPQLKLLETYVP